MEDKSLELLSEEGRKLHDEFVLCQNWEEVEAFLKKVEKLNETREKKPIPHYNMTLEEFRAKYHTTSHEEIMKRMGWE